MEKVRVGIIGCGMITKRRHAPEYADNQNAQIMGFYDANYARAQEFAAIYDAKAYKTVEDLVDDEEIDAVSVCSPNFTHTEYTIMGLNAGKHVLCEKPMAMNLEDSRKMMSAAEAAGKTLMLGHNQRLLPTHKKAKEVLDTGVIGKILYIQSNFKHSGPESWSTERSNATWFFDKRQAQFGALGDLGAHKLDIIRFMTGCEVEEVNATLMTLDKRYPNGKMIDIEDNAVAMFRLENGIQGAMSVGWTNYGEEDNSTIIYGDK
ncbi:MAG: Gfo/Idh/MocA family oxidoreductase, partial [Oscillospiraceae bacterium]